MAERGPHPAPAGSPVRRYVFGPGGGACRHVHIEDDAGGVLAILKVADLEAAPDDRQPRLVARARREFTEYGDLRWHKLRKKFHRKRVKDLDGEAAVAPETGHPATPPAPAPAPGPPAEPPGRGRGGR